jgi:carboxypeptidase Taq
LLTRLPANILVQIASEIMDVTAVSHETVQSARPCPVERELNELKARLAEIADLAGTAALLSWDQATYMPRCGAEARARQSALVNRLVHERRTDPALGRLLDRLDRWAETLDSDSDDARLLRVARRDFERAMKVPAPFVARLSAAGSQSYDAWTRARPADDFAAMRPHLERMLDLTREYVEFFAPYRHPADPLIDMADEGMTSASVRALFAELRRELQPIVAAICSQPVADTGCLRGFYADAPQLAFALVVASAFGYDFDRGRLDRTHHPFCTRFSWGDVRITTRVDEGDITGALFSTLHEAGHALYEQGTAAEFAGTPLGRGTSVGVHESQSRLWENLVGRSLGFWQHFYPRLQSLFPERLGGVAIDTFYRAINKVERSLIRTEADEVTYNLHVMLRFELELELLEGKLAVEDLPEAWRERYQSYLSITPPDDRDGCLQDVHWYDGLVGGAFHSYTIGNVLSAQFYSAAVRVSPAIARDLAAGDFAGLRSWLRENVYRHGRKFRPDEIVLRATGSPLTIEPYIAYLRNKYGALYHLPAQ